MTSSILYGIIGGGIVLVASLLVVAVDLATRGPERRETERRRKAARSGIEVPARLPRLRVVLRRMERDR